MDSSDLFFLITGCPRTDRPQGGKENAHSTEETAIAGRDELPIPEKVKLDEWYLKSRSLPLDLKILGMTFVQVISRKGISAEGCATMPEFLGSGAKGVKNQGL